MGLRTKETKDSHEFNATINDTRYPARSQQIQNGQGFLFCFSLSVSLSLSLSELDQRAPDQQSQLLKDSGVLC